MLQGGYVGCIPSENEGVRGNMIFVVLCGPLIAIIAGIGLFSLALASPGTALEPYWEVPAILALLFVVDSLVNLIPAGNLDGALLLHLILWTERGKAYVASLRGGKLREDATAIRNTGNLEDEVELLERALRDAVEDGERRPDALASHYTALGFGLLRVQRWAEAEAALKKSVDYLESGIFDPGLAANTWMGLHTLYHATQRASEAERAYAASVAAFSKVLGRRIPRAAACSIRGALGRMHVDQGQYEAGLDELERALEDCPADAAHDLDRAVLLRSRAECQFLLGMPDRGMNDSAQAANIFRAAVEHSSEAPKALGELGALGAVLWKSGRWQRAADIVQEAAEGFKARGLSARSSAQRLLLSLILRNAGRLEEALAALPGEANGSARENLLTARGHIALLSGRIVEAVRDFEECVGLARQANARPARIAELEAALAEAYLESGRDADAETLAAGARAVLQETQHPDQSDALLVLARLDWKRGLDGSAFWRGALEAIHTAPLMEPATRARWLQQTAAKLTRDGHFAEAEEARNAAAADWNRLGCPLESVQHEVHHDAGYAHVHPDR